MARGLLVEALVGGSLFLLGKLFDVVILTFRCLYIFSGYGLYLCLFSFPQVEAAARTSPALDGQEAQGGRGFQGLKLVVHSFLDIIGVVLPLC